MTTEFYLISDTDNSIATKFTTTSFNKNELVFLNNTLYVIKKIVHDLDNNKKLIILGQ